LNAYISHTVSSFKAKYLILMSRVFLENLIFAYWLRNHTGFIILESLLPCSQDPAIGPYTVYVTSVHTKLLFL
jgi:hypothetical protein